MRCVPPTFYRQKVCPPIHGMLVYRKPVRDEASFYRAPIHSFVMWTIIQLYSALINCNIITRAFEQHLQVLHMTGKLIALYERKVVLPHLIAYGSSTHTHRKWRTGGKKLTSRITDAAASIHRSQ